MKASQCPSENWSSWMRRALQLASLGEGCTSPNPLVGALVLDIDGRLVGESFHSRAGQPHAEIGALAQAGERAKGGTLVVTLEPCCHTGRTPPCTQAILKSGISLVVIALEDPDPRVAGKGIQILRNAGIKVLTGVLSSQAKFQNRAFIFRIKHGRPWGILKWAMSIDGRTALTNGQSKWITGSESREWVYQLRAKCDAVIVGGGTLRADNPLLTSRGIAYPEPLRVVLSKSLNLPQTARIWNTSEAKTILASSFKLLDKNELQIPVGPDLLDLESTGPINLLEKLAERDCNQILWECGPKLATAAINQECVQEIFVFVAPKLLGGIVARTPLGDFGFESMDQVLSFGFGSLQKLGKDFLLNIPINKI